MDSMWDLNLFYQFINLKKDIKKGMIIAQILSTCCVVILEIFHIETGSGGGG